MAYKDKRVAAYKNHVHHAKSRGIVFNLTFEEWWTLWNDSGHWSKRGICRGQYVMARFEDLGAYEVENVEIITCSANINQPQVRRKQGKTITGRRHSVEHRRNLSRAKIGNSNAKGKHWTLSEETRQRQSLGQLGNKKSLGKVWLTNGELDKFVDPPGKLPKGWRRGRSGLRRK